MRSANQGPGGGAGTPERILDAAERLFAERGYGRTTLRAIAEAVGIQNPSLYSHFSSKEALYQAVLERALRPLLDEFWDTENEIEKDLRHLAAHPHVAPLLLHETLDGGRRLSPAAVRWVAETISRSKAFLEKAQGPERWSTVKLSLRVLAIYHVVAGYFASSEIYQRLTGADLQDEAVLAEQLEIVDAVSRALFATVEGER